MEKGICYHVVSKRLADVALGGVVEVMKCTNMAFETKGRRGQMFKTGVSVVPQNN